MFHKEHNFYPLVSGLNNFHTFEVAEHSKLKIIILF